MTPNDRRPARRGFTIIELVAALAILAVALTAVAELGTWSLRERARAAARLAAVELAANVLEAARAVPADELTPDWAKAQRLPTAFGPRGWTLTVRVEPEPSRRHTRRVTVTVEADKGAGLPAPLAELTGLFSARSAPSAGGRP